MVAFEMFKKYFYAHLDFIKLLLHKYSISINNVKKSCIKSHYKAPFAKYCLFLFIYVYCCITTKRRLPCTHYTILKKCKGWCRLSVV